MAAKLIVFPILFLSVVVSAFWFGDLTLNTTASLPLGIWRQQRFERIDESLRGRFVIFCPPDTEVFRSAKDAGILQSGVCPGSYTPLLKQVVGLPGDVVEYSDGLSINGMSLPNSSIRLLSFKPDLPRFRRLVVPKDHLWLMSSYSPASFDSRYFGLVDIERVVGLAEPLIVSN